MSSLVPVDIKRESILINIDGVVFRLHEMSAEKHDEFAAAGKAMTDSFEAMRALNLENAQWATAQVDAGSSDADTETERVQRAEAFLAATALVKASSLAVCRMILSDRRDGHKRGEGVTDVWIADHVFQSTYVEQIMQQQAEINAAGLRGLGNFLRGL